MSRSAILCAMILAACGKQTPPDTNGGGPTCPATNGATTGSTPCADSSGACDPTPTEPTVADALGCWELVSAIGSRESTMVVGPSGIGEARLFFYTGRTLWFADFDVRASNATPPMSSDDTTSEPSTTGSGDTDARETTDAPATDGDGSTALEVVPTFMLEFECDGSEADEGGCSELDFEAECQRDATVADRLLCSPGPPWTNFPFVWKKGLD